MFRQRSSQRVTSVDTAGMVLELLLAAEAAGRTLPGGALEGDPIHTGAFTFSLEAFVGVPPAAAGLLHCAHKLPHVVFKDIWYLDAKMQQSAALITRTKGSGSKLKTAVAN